VKGKVLSHKLFLPFCVFLFFAWLVYSELHPPLPTEKKPLIFYSNQTRHNLKRVFARSIKNAKHRLFVKVYGVTDSDIIDLLSKKAEMGIETKLIYDPSASPNIQSSHIDITPLKVKGLMHKKIFIVDDALVLLGSANLTPHSLKMHDNLLIGFYHRDLANFLQQPDSFHLKLSLDDQTLDLFQLPDRTNQAIGTLISLIDSAQESIRVAMFTFTHPKLEDALIRARQRDLTVEVAIDHYAGQGSSKNTMKHLDQAGVSVYFSQGKQLLHHKWVLIDGKTLAAGSANWTKSAFAKNEDCLLILDNLKKDQQKFLFQLWKVIKCGSKHL
jgi:phosphatidylserine/phosphatidylglycerophosphate/cardiolipin synthase-like enzyme